MYLPKGKMLDAQHIFINLIIEAKLIILTL